MESTYTNTSNTNLYIALKNPFRYRGYYYDSETGLYYLNSRYYDPEIGRFINIDDISVLDITNIALNGINLYAYCLNNPVNEADESGYFILSFLIGLGIAVGVGALAGGTAYVVTEVVSYATTGEWNWSWANFFGSIIGGGIGGAISFMLPGLGVVGGAFLTGAISTAVSMGLQKCLGRNELFF